MPDIGVINSWVSSITTNFVHVISGSTEVRVAFNRIGPTPADAYANFRLANTPYVKANVWKSFA